MKTNAEIQQERRILIETMGDDGGMGWIPGLDIKKPERRAFVIWSDGGGWDHVSVSWQNRCPTWEEMAKVKQLFFHPEEVCVEFHPAESEYVNMHPYCLHIWRYQQPGMPMPPAWMVGEKEMQTRGDAHREEMAAMDDIVEVRLTRQELDDLDTMRKIRSGEIRKKGCYDYVIYNGDFYRENPWNVPKEKPTGRWLRVPDAPGDEDNPAWDCSECDAMCAKQYDFCPCCGAKMEKEAKQE